MSATGKLLLKEYDLGRLWTVPAHGGAPEAVSQRDMTTRVLWAGAGLDGVTGVVSARSVVERFDRIR